MGYIYRGSAIAEEPRDALRQLKYYGRFLTKLLTRSSANPQEKCKHIVSWNRVKCCTNVRRIACENVLSVILGLATFVQLRLVTDGQTDGRTDRRTHDDS